ncbi:MAG: cupin domain-containing protein [Spirochaetaceae bacterium]|nr:MAG: cupin domain-containing protein [Spirochaetaceae bacterium]
MNKSDGLPDSVVHRTAPFRVPTADDKVIEEHFGRAVGGGNALSIAHMVAPPGWSEPAQTPEFGEFTLVSRGRKRVILPDGPVILEAGQSLYVPPGVRVQYSNPFGEETEYWSVCVPAFSPDLVHREES